MIESSDARSLDFLPSQVDDAVNGDTLQEANSMSSHSTAARGRYSGFPSGWIRFLSDLRRAIKPYGRRMTTEERRRYAREAAKDPNVDRILKELLAERPELRMSDARRSGLRR